MSKMLQFNSKTSLSRIKCTSIYTVCIVKHRPPPPCSNNTQTRTDQIDTKTAPVSKFKGQCATHQTI